VSSTALLTSPIVTGDGAGVAPGVAAAASTGAARRAARKDLGPGRRESNALASLEEIVGVPLLLGRAQSLTVSFKLGVLVHLELAVGKVNKGGAALDREPPQLVLHPFQEALHVTVQPLLLPLEHDIGMVDAGAPWKRCGGCRLPLIHLPAGVDPRHLQQTLLAGEAFPKRRHFLPNQGRDPGEGLSQLSFLLLNIDWMPA